MALISAAEAAEKWGVSLRQVQRFLAAGRVPDAKKYGHSWMLPVDAPKPGDPRRERKTPPSPLPADLARLIEGVFVSVPRSNPDGILDAVSDERLLRIHEGALAYARGDFERSRRCFRALGDDAAKLCAASIAIATAISLGDYGFYLEIETFLQGIVRADIGPDVTAFAQLGLATGHLGAIAPGMVPEWLKTGDFAALPQQARPDAAHMRAKYFQCVGKPESMLAVAETALSFCDSEREMSFADTYLRLMRAAACYAQGRMEDAERHLLDVMRINLPHGFITPFAEVMPLYGGLLERLLQREYRERHDAVLAQWKRTFANWLGFHNRFTRDHITQMLSLREYQIARLATQGVPNEEIAARMQISVGRLKNLMQVIYAKLYATNRRELEQYIL